jgi:uncharacterized protein
VLRAIAFPFWNRDERRLRAFLRVAIQLALFFAIGPLSIALLVLRAASGSAWARGVEEYLRTAFSPGASIEEHFRMASISAVLLFVAAISVFLACRFLDRRPIEAIGLRADRSFWIDAAFGSLLGVFLMFGILATEVGFGWAEYRVAPALSTELPRIAFFALGAIVFTSFAIIEELFFRGYMLTNFADSFATARIRAPHAILLATGLSAFLFALAHADNPHASMLSNANLLVAGFMLAAGYVTTARLGLPIGLHIAWNFAQNFFGMPVSGQDQFFYARWLVRDEHGPDWITGGAFGPEAGLTGLIAMAIGIALSLAWARVRYGALGLDPRIADTPREVIRARSRAG